MTTFHTGDSRGSTVAAIALAERTDRQVLAAIATEGPFATIGSLATAATRGCARAHSNAGTS